MIAILLWLAFYSTGYWLAFSMLRIEHEAEKLVYTKGTRILAFVLALFSWLMVFNLLIKAWWDKIAATGFWHQPVNDVEVKGKEKKNQSAE